MVDADHHLDGNNISKRTDSAVELADAINFGTLNPSAYAQEEPFLGARNAKKYKVDWNPPQQGVLKDPLISDITEWIKYSSRE